MIIGNYNPTKHDIYLFDGVPTFNFASPPGSNAFVNPTGYNPNNIRFDSKYRFPSIDLSGLHVRRRGFGGSPNQWQAKILQTELDCIQTGNCTDQQKTSINDYNKWNNGQYAGVLISPQHVLACNHYVGPNLTSQFLFIGKDGKFYFKNATKVAALISDSVYASYPREWYANCIRIGNEDQDMVLFKLDEPFSAEEQENVKVYSFVDLKTIPPRTIVFHQDPNGKIFTLKVVFTNNQYNFLEEYQGDENIPKQKDVLFAGDSGSPRLINLDGETCFLSLTAGGNSLSESNQQKLIEYVENDIGYTIPVVNGGYVYEPLKNLTPYTPLTETPYLSRYSTKEISLDFDFLGFRPTFSLQASELNELQELFFAQQSKTIEMIHNWFGFRFFSSKSDNGPSNLSPVFLQYFGSSCLSDKWSVLTPINPNMIKLVTDSNNETKSIQIDSGWYFLKNTSLDFSAYKWIYLPINYLIPQTAGKYITLKIENKELIPLPGYPDDNTVFLQDNINPSNSNEVGATRFATSFKLDVYPQEHELPSNSDSIEDPIICYNDLSGKTYLPNGHQL